MTIILFVGLLLWLKFKYMFVGPLQYIFICRSIIIILFVGLLQCLSFIYRSTMSILFVGQLRCPYICKSICRICKPILRFPFFIRQEICRHNGPY